MDQAPASLPVDVLPPTSPRIAYRTGLVGLGLSALAAVIGLVADYLLTAGPGVQSTARLLLVGIGALVAGSAVSLRPGLWPSWAIAAATALLAAVAGLPEHWDSGRLLASVFAGLAVSGAVLVAVPARVRLSVLSLLVVFHFGGILCATTLPEPTPWLVSQVGNRVYMPYLSFVYLRNAYHFYSPEPGPASHLFVLLKYELDEIDPKTGKPKVVHEWQTLPRRDEHYRDPLGLTYYRRLSITEMVAGTLPDPYLPNSAEKLSAKRRRIAVAVGLGNKEPIPLAPPEFEPESLQYRVPLPHVTRYLLPAYARHLAVEYSAPGRRVVAVKMYRVEHRIVPPSELVRGADPYDPIRYRPYYVGTYDPEGHLTDPDDPMLYWLVPVMPRPGGAAPLDPKGLTFDDYLSKHAGFEFVWRRP
jgi:hypothetical protein